MPDSQVPKINTLEHNHDMYKLETLIVALTHYNKIIEIHIISLILKL